VIRFLLRLTTSMIASRKASSRSRSGAPLPQRRPGRRIEKAGPDARRWRATAAERARADLAELTQMFETGQLHATGTTLPLAEVVRAHRLLEDRTVAGRLVLVP